MLLSAQVTRDIVIPLLVQVCQADAVDDTTCGCVGVGVGKETDTKTLSLLKFRNCIDIQL